jgi:hypothetical protein
MHTRNRSWSITLVALMAVLFMSVALRADATTTSDGTVNGTVTTDGSPAVNAKVMVFKARDRKRGAGAAGAGTAPGGVGGAAAAGGADGADGKKTRPQPLMTSTTDGDGKFTLSLPAGEYLIVVGEKGEGRGHERVSVVAGQAASVAITLTAKKPTSQPAAN